MKQGDIPSLVERVGALMPVERAFDPMNEYTIKGEDLRALLDALSQPKDAVGGGVPAGMVAWSGGPGFMPTDYDGGPVQLSDGTIGQPVGHLWQPFGDVVVTAYTPKAASSYDGDAARERIARIIDPGKWAVLDSYLADMLRKYKGEHIGYDPESFKDKASLAKADAILAALPTSDASERLREDNYALREALIACGRHAGAFLADGVSTDFLMCIPEEVRLKIAALSNNEVSE